ncbi:FkbM family methyltransferase [Sphingobacterium haloxyli]|uniref:SAM-dependent methyltransferase n=1 Tax=Sphingobacterium haloxyli TaxID=2100533 RepID=A0A2S9J829_9SPHI|nr:FkbM family methyltransferase [Sphingobacterium haloxyli]PRD48922.1 SAM-dependent methyltransferase [Sphingobacterium haloxyli]
MPSFKKTLLKYVPLDNFLSYRSYSQEGEDVVLLSFYEGKKKYRGFYVDVGAHHPYRFSNTMAFYKRGWKGINIEPNPDAMKWFRWFRKRDVNLNVGIAENNGTLTYYCFNEPALNGFSKRISEERDHSTRYSITNTIAVPVRRLDAVLDEHLKENTEIDFLSIDAEGFDLAVLQSNNWVKYRPRYILVEDNFEIGVVPTTPIIEFLKQKGYRMVAKTKRTLFFGQAEILP